MLRCNEAELPQQAGGPFAPRPEPCTGAEFPPGNPRRPYLRHHPRSEGATPAPGAPARAGDHRIPHWGPALIGAQFLNFSAPHSIMRALSLDEASTGSRAIRRADRPRLAARAGHCCVSDATIRASARPGCRVAAIAGSRNRRRAACTSGRAMCQGGRAAPGVAEAVCGASDGPSPQSVVPCGGR